MCWRLGSHMAWYFRSFWNCRKWSLAVGNRSLGAWLWGSYHLPATSPHLFSLPVYHVVKYYVLPAMTSCYTMGSEAME
jgi:hypothetical protein